MAKMYEVILNIETNYIRYSENVDIYIIYAF